MCVVEVVMAVSQMAGTLINGIGALREEKAQNKYQTNLLLSEAKYAEQDAVYERQEGIEQARREKLNSILNMAEKKSGIAANNIALSSGTALNVLESEKLNGELDALTTLKNSERRADLQMRTAIKYYNQAELQSYKTKRSYKKGMLSLISDAAGNPLILESIKSFS